MIVCAHMYMYCIYVLEVDLEAKVEWGSRSSLIIVSIPRTRNYKWGPPRIMDRA